MTKEEAKILLVEAHELTQGRKYQEALTILQQIRTVFPDSGRVIQQQAFCLIGLGKLEEAEQLCPLLEQLAGSDVSVIRSGIQQARNTSGIASAPQSPVPPTTVTPPLVKGPVAENEFFVESVSPVSTEETCVMGHVAEGAFFSGSMVSVITATGLPLLAPILRLGTQYAPLNVIRKGPLATMFLQIEPEHVAVGAKIFSTDSGAAQAPTMIVSAKSISDKPKINSPSPELLEARRLLDNRMFNEAKQLLGVSLSRTPNDAEAHRLMARLSLEAEHELNNPQKAMHHIAKAYEIAGHEQPEVIEVLAQTLGANGQCEHGLRHLERLYETTDDIDQKNLYAQRITSFRTRYQIPDLWQFIDSMGTILIESTDPDKIQKALENRNIPPNALFRKNKVGVLLPVKDWQLTRAQSHHAPLAPTPAESDTPYPNNTMTKLIGALIGVILVAGLNLFISIESTLFLVFTMLIAGTIGWFLAALAGNALPRT